MSPLFLFAAALVAAQVFLRLRMPKVTEVDRSTIGGSNARNTALWIKMANDLTPDNFVAIFCQEFYESRRKAWILLALLQPIPYFRRQSELMGHETEVQAWTGDKDERRADEARALKTGRSYKGLFDKWSEEDIIKAMKDRSSKARKWADKAKDHLDD